MTNSNTTKDAGGNEAEKKIETIPEMIAGMLPWATDGLAGIARRDVLRLIAEYERLATANADLLGALEEACEDADRQCRADAPGVAPDWYTAAKAAITKATGAK